MYSGLSLSLLLLEYLSVRMLVCVYECICPHNILYISLYFYTKALYERERERELNIIHFIMSNNI